MTDGQHTIFPQLVSQSMLRITGADTPEADAWNASRWQGELRSLDHLHHSSEGAEDWLPFERNPVVQACITAITNHQPR